MDSVAIIKELRNRFGAIVANGQGSMKGKIFRLAHLGYFDTADLFAVVAALEIALLKLGYKLELGSGVRAAQQAYLRLVN
jgi:aspartate aminotransferase-like enzyme